MTTVEVTRDTCAANGVGLRHLQDEMVHTLILHKGRQHGIIHLPDYLFWIIPFEIIGSNLQTLLGLEDFVLSCDCFPSALCVLGKVAIQKEDLQKYHNRDTWFQLQHVDADSEVQVRPLAEPVGCWRSLGMEDLIVVKGIETGFWS